MIKDRDQKTDLKLKLEGKEISKCEKKNLTSADCSESSRFGFEPQVLVHASDLGMHAVTVPHGPDGSVLRSPFPSPFPAHTNHWMDGAWDGQGPSMPVVERPSTDVRT